MIVYGSIFERVKEKVEKIDADNTNVNKLVEEIKIYLIKSSLTKGISVSLAEDVIARMIVAIALVENK